MAETRIGLIDFGALDSGGAPRKIEFFDREQRRQQIAVASGDDPVTVTLSTGKSVTVDSRFLRLLRVLAEELATGGTLRH